jgi:hypothetical protein
MINDAARSIQSLMWLSRHLHLIYDYKTVGGIMRESSAEATAIAIWCGCGRNCSLIMSWAVPVKRRLGSRRNGRRLLAMTSFQLRRELLGKWRPLAKGWAVLIDHIH